MKILYQGNEGAYSQLAAVEIFPQANLISCKTFEDCFQKCINDETFMWQKEEEPFDQFVVNSTPNRNSKLPLHETLDPLNVNMLTQFADYVYNIVGNS